MKFNFFRFLLPLLCMIFAVGSFGQDIPVPSTGDELNLIVKAVLDLVTNFKSMSGVAIGGGILVIAIQLLKGNLLSFLFKSEKSKMIKTTITLILGSISSVLVLVMSGSGWLEASIAGIFTSGAAVAIYKAIRAFKQS